MRGRLAPYLLVLPGGLWLAIFFVLPMIEMLSFSLMQGDVVNGFRFTGHWRNYTDGLSAYSGPLVRSLVYGLLATVACALLAYPAAYWIAFRGGARKTTYLFLMLLPFFVSFVLRTFSWKFLLADDGMVLGPLKDAELLPRDFHVVATGFAVVAGLTYNYLPFMVLPVYVALERIDPTLIEAARDLYAGRRQVFGRVVLPLSLPGVFAGVLMTFVPVSTDYVNATVLGGTNNTMIGNVIQNLFLVNTDYPQAAALSFTLMTILLVGIFGYAKALGTEAVPVVAAR